MIRRIWHAWRRLLAQLFCPYDQPAVQTFSDPMITIEAKPRRVFEGPTEPEGTVQTFSDPMITIEAKPRRKI